MAAKPSDRVITLIEPDESPESGTLVADLGPLARRSEMRHHIEEARDEVNDEAPTTIHDLPIEVDDSQMSAPADVVPTSVSGSLEREIARARPSLWPPILVGICIGLAVLAYLGFLNR